MGPLSDLRISPGSLDKLFKIKWVDGNSNNINADKKMLITNKSEEDLVHKE
jgi:hypothetical protein